MPSDRETRKSRVKALAAARMEERKIQDVAETASKKRKVVEVGGSSSQPLSRSPARPILEGPPPVVAADVPAGSHQAGQATVGALDPFLRASSRIPLGVSKQKGSSSSSLPSSIFCPQWEVREGSSVLDPQVAAEMGSHLMTPRDVGIFKGLSVGELRQLEFQALGQLGTAAAEIWRRYEQTRERSRVSTSQAAEIGQRYKDEVGSRERAEAEVARLKEVETLLSGKLQQKEDSLREKDNFLFQKNDILLKQSEEISLLQGQVLSIREHLSQSQTEIHRLKEELSLTSFQAVEDFRRSEEFTEELLSAYAACWDEAAKLCTEQGSLALAALMAERGESLGVQSEDKEVDLSAGVTENIGTAGGGEVVAPSTGAQRVPPTEAQRIPPSESSAEVLPPTPAETDAADAPFAV